MKQRSASAPTADALALAAIRDGDPAGIAAIYEHHGSAVYGFCRAVLGDDARAEAVVIGVFTAAGPLLIALGDPDPARVRSALLALARREALRQCSSFPSSPSTPDPTAGPAGSARPGTALAPTPAALGELLASWIGELDPGDRAVVELAVRHGLHGEAFAEVVGRTPPAAEVLRQNVLERATLVLRSQLVALTDAGSCPELAAIVAEWDRTASPLVPSPIVQHVPTCARCAPRQLADPLSLVAAAPAPAPGPELRRRVLLAVTTPDAAAGLIAAPTPADADVAATEVFAEGPPSRRRLTGALVAAALVVLVVIAARVSLEGSDGSEPEGTDGAGTASTTRAAGSTGLAREPGVTTTTVETLTPTTTPVPSTTFAPSTTTPAPPTTPVEPSTTTAEPASPAEPPPTSVDPNPPAAPESSTPAEPPAPPAEPPPGSEPPPTTATAPETQSETAPSDAPPVVAPEETTPPPLPPPPPPSPAAEVPVDASPPRFRAVRATPGVVYEGTPTCRSNDRSLIAADVDDDSGTVTVTGDWAVRGTAVSGTIAFSSERTFGFYTGWLGPVPDAIASGSAPIDLHLTAVDPTGNRRSVVDSLLLRNC